MELPCVGQMSASVDGFAIWGCVVCGRASAVYGKLFVLLHFVHSFRGFTLCVIAKTIASTVMMHYCCTLGVFHAQPYPVQSIA